MILNMVGYMTVYRCIAIEEELSRNQQIVLHSSLKGHM